MKYRLKSKVKGKSRLSFEYDTLPEAKAAQIKAKRLGVNCTIVNSIGSAV